VADVDFVQPASALIPASVPPLPEPDPELEAPPELDPELDAPSARESGAASFGRPESDPDPEELDPLPEPEPDADAALSPEASGSVGPESLVLEQAATRTRDENDSAHTARRIIGARLPQTAAIAYPLPSPALGTWSDISRVTALRAAVVETDGEMQVPEAMAIRLVCFDLGGVLVRIWGTWDDARRAASLSARAEPSAPELEESHRSLGALFEVGRISFDEWAAGVSRAFEGAYSPDEAKRAHHAIPRQEYAGALALIDELHDAGVATACLSNTNHAHWIRLVHHDGVAALPGEPEYPSVVRLKRHFASHLLGMAKPDGAIYAEVERLVGLEGPEILFFDDRADNVEAARHRHWRAHRIDPQGDTIAQVRQSLRDYRLLVHFP
jgi:glucose-1-phosphatase